MTVELVALAVLSGNCGGWEDYGGYVLRVKWLCWLCWLFCYKQLCLHFKIFLLWRGAQPEPQYLFELAMIKKWPGIALVLVSE